MVYLPEKFEVSSAGPHMSLEPRRSLERGGLERGGLWRLDEILPAAVDDLLSTLEATLAADGTAELATAQRAAEAAEPPGRPQSPWIAAPMLNRSPLELHESATIGDAVSVF